MGAESSEGTGDDDAEVRYCGGDASGGDDGCGGGDCCWCCGVVTKFNGLNFSRRGVVAHGGDGITGGGRRSRDVERSSRRGVAYGTVFGTRRDVLGRGDDVTGADDTLGRGAGGTMRRAGCSNGGRLSGAGGVAKRSTRGGGTNARNDGSDLGTRGNCCRSGGGRVRGGDDVGETTSSISGVDDQVGDGGLGVSGPTAPAVDGVGCTVVTSAALECAAALPP